MPRRPGSPLVDSSLISGPFLLVYFALLAVAPLVMGPGRLPLGQGLDFFVSPVPSSPPGATVGPASPIFTPRCPFSCPQLDAFSICLNVPSPVGAERVPRPGLLLGLIRARARCSRVVPVLAVPCSPALPFSGGDGGATYLRGVPPIPEVPERVLVPNPFKRLHIHAVPSSSMPARPSLHTSPDDPRALLRAACLVSGARQLVLYPTPW